MKSAPESGGSHKHSSCPEVEDIDFGAEAFLAFSARLDAQIEQLVAKWQHLAAPRALRAGRGSLNPSKQAS